VKWSEVEPLKGEYDYLAPDGSEIRLLSQCQNGGFAHCRLPAGAVTAAVRHRTVEELWYVVSGEGEIWRQRDGEEPQFDHLREGDSLRIPVGVSFQFRASPYGGLNLLLATMPPWPGAHEAVPTIGPW
jgi:mannose-6-phosphate isomerase-like protein (cupin superfamily)